jgi:FdhD protein
MGRLTVRRSILRVRDGQSSRHVDSLTAEEPLEVRIGGRALAVTMRTPGHDFELAAGFLVSEGVVYSSDHVAAIRYCAGVDANRSNSYNVVDVVLAPGVPAPDASLVRNVYTTSSCGLCGKASLETVRTSAHWSVKDDPLTVVPDTLTVLPERLRAAQRLFESTGGLHAAGLFAANGELLCLREDVGRHNAVDKVIGYALTSALLPLRATILMVSGRASFELVQKALMAGIPMMAAVSAPSSLAVDLAVESGLTLVGFLRGSSMNIYAGAARLKTTTTHQQTSSDVVR